jgi:uncharacterized hydrophobic protein (TIGR00271 family)
MSFRNSQLYIRYKNFLKQIDHIEIYKELEDAQRIDISYIALVIISAHIATLGLFINSPAVIIGAMIISPLMGPIMAGGLSFAISNKNLGRKAFKSISLGIFLSVFFSAVITLVIPLKENTIEILVRTSPNILDLFIALFSGLAGAFAVTFKKISGSIVGVAISVALMPPLCVAGIGIGTNQADVSLGGFFLFLTNLTAIFIASSLFFLLFGFFIHDKHDYSNKALYRKYFISFFLLLLLSIPLIYTLDAAIKDKAKLAKIESVLSKNFDVTDQSKLDTWKLTDNRIVIKIDTVSNIPEEKIDLVKQEVKAAAGQEINLDIIQIPVFSLYQHGRKPVSSLLLDAASGKVAPQEKSQSEAERTAEEEGLALYKFFFEQIVIVYPFIDGYQLKYDQNNDLKSIAVTIDPEYVVSVEQVNSIISYLEKLGSNIEIEVITENISAPPVYFEANTSELAAGEQQKLDKLALLLNEHPGCSLTAAGHADSEGDREYNESLARMRAETVANYLIQKSGVAPDRIATSYAPEADLEQELEEGRKEQRRVDLMVTTSGGLHVVDRDL